MREFGPLKKLAVLPFVMMAAAAMPLGPAWGQEVETTIPESVGMSSKMLANVDQLAEQAIADAYLKGAVVLIARHGEIVYFKAFGEADEGEPMRKDSIFRLASMTKTPVAVALLQLWDQGRVGLGDPVSDYIPEFANIEVLAEASGDGFERTELEREITVHDVLSFTSGMSATYMSALGPEYRQVAECYADQSVQDLMSETYTKPLLENVKNATRCPLVDQPGARWIYSNVSMDTVAALVEVISGQPLDAYLREHVFGPLGVEEMWFYPPEEVHDRIPAVFDEPGDLVKRTNEWEAGTGVIGPLYTFGKNKQYFSAGGGLHGTTGGYYRFAQMLLNGGELDGTRILSPQAVELMTTVQVGDGPKFRNLFSSNEWGYGVDVQAENHMRPVSDWYGGPGSYGWRGYFSTMYFNDPVDGTVVMTMAQTPRHGYSWGVKVNTAASAAVVD